MKKAILIFAALFAFGALFGARKNVVLIGLDGWAGCHFDKYEMPTIKKICSEGAYTTKKRSVLPSVSAPNWTSILTGCGVELHGHTKWNSEVPDLPSRVVSKYGKCPGIFGVLRDAYPDIKTACFYDWNVIGSLVETRAANTVQFFKPSPTCEAVADAASKYIVSEKPDFVFVYFSQPDEDGHKYGFGSPEYMERLKKLDKLVEKVVQAVRDSGKFDDTVFVIVSDHGGKGKSHSGISLEESEAPFIVWGAGIRKNFEITDSVVSIDVAPTIAEIMGVKELPQVWTGRPVRQIFEK